MLNCITFDSSFLISDLFFEYKSKRFFEFENSFPNLLPFLTFESTSKRDWNLGDFEIIADYLNFEFKLGETIKLFIFIVFDDLFLFEIFGLFFIFSKFLTVSLLKVLFFNKKIKIFH